MNEWIVTVSLIVRKGRHRWFGYVEIILTAAYIVQQLV